MKDELHANSDDYISRVACAFGGATVDVQNINTILLIFGVKIAIKSNDSFPNGKPDFRISFRSTNYLTSKIQDNIFTVEVTTPTVASLVVQRFGF